MDPELELLEPLPLEPDPELELRVKLLPLLLLLRVRVLPEEPLELWEKELPLRELPECELLDELREDEELWEELRDEE